MKIQNLKHGMIALAIALVFASCGGDKEQKGTAETPEAKIEQAKTTNGSTVQFVSVDVYSFEKERGTARLDVKLDNPVALMQEDVSTSVGKVSLVQCSTGDTKYWRVDLEGLSSTAPQEVTITIKKDKYNFEPNSRKVTLE